MNSELKKQVLEALKLGKESIWSDSRFIHECDDPSIVKLKSTIAAVEAEPDPTQKLTADQIESCFPSGGDTNENGITVSAQWLHDFARNVESKVIVTPVRVWNERDVEIVKETLEAAYQAISGDIHQDEAQENLKTIDPAAVLSGMSKQSEGESDE